MRQIELPYEELKQDFIKELAKLGSEGLYERGILATSDENHVTARRMRLVSNSLTIYCWTARNSRKHKQIIANPNVAVVAGFVQIEGVASVKGHPKDEPEFLKVYKETQPSNYEREVSHWNQMDYILIEIAPKRIALFKYADLASGRTESGLDILNIVKGEAYSIFGLDHMNADHSDAPAYSG